MDREEIDHYFGHPGFAGAESVRRCPRDGGYFYASDGRCEYCGKTTFELEEEGAYGN